MAYQIPTEDDVQNSEQKKERKKKEKTVVEVNKEIQERINWVGAIDRSGNGLEVVFFTWSHKVAHSEDQSRPALIQTQADTDGIRGSITIEEEGE